MSAQTECIQLTGKKAVALLRSCSSKGFRPRVVNRQLMYNNEIHKTLKLVQCRQVKRFDVQAKLVV